VTTISSSEQLPTEVELKPSYVISLVLVGTAIPLAAIAPWVSVVIALFGVFLLIQTISIRLKFTTTALEVYRQSNLIRSFSYREWQNWRIFWQPVPILFYFKEVNSIHFLPIIFDSKMLRTCLELYVGDKGR
jgi:hypothetical protein